MLSAIENLHLDRLDVLYAGSETFPLTRQIRAIPVEKLWAPETRL